MTAQSIFSAAARDAIVVNGQPIVYSSSDRIINTAAVITRSVAEIGFDAQSGESRWIAELIVADVGNVRRGDTIADSGGRNWMTREELSGDEYTTTWSLDRT